MSNKNQSKVEESVVVIRPIQKRTLQLWLIGDEPLICNAWSEKAREEMRVSQGVGLPADQPAPKKAKAKHKAKDPKACFEGSLYPLPEGGYGFPSIAFKASAVSAARFTGAKMTELRGSMFIRGAMVRIHGDDPVMREDMVRVGGMGPGTGKADLRYRGEFRRWAVCLDIEFNAAMIGPSQIVDLFNNAGFGIGVGEWRPEKGAGNCFGRFHVATEGEHEEFIGGKAAKRRAA